MKCSSFFMPLYFFLCPTLLVACPPDEPIQAKDAIKEINSLLDESNNVSAPKVVPKTSKKDTNILVLGGGYSPSGNQISLESNVKYFRKILQYLRLENAPMETFFADGREKGRDIQFFDPDFPVPEINQVMAEIFGKTNGLANQYRTNQLMPDGTSSIANVDKWFEKRKKTDSTEKNLIYFTGHGGKGDSKNPHNTTAYLWSTNRLKVTDFVKKLDQLPEKQPTILVMVQCYSGGFANVIFKEGNPKNEVSSHSRAGFFSTTQTRVAAGCTPDIREENYQEYSTFFWEALSGFSRMGKPIRKPDYNADGKISMTEAHSYVCIQSNTIDVPIKTSDILLRKFLPNELSQKPIQKKPAQKKVAEIIDKYIPEIFKNESNSTKSRENQKLEDFSKAILLKWANPEEKAVLTNLSEILKLNTEFPAKEIKVLQESLKKEREEIQKDKKKASDQRNKLRNEIKKKLIAHYPECSNPFHPVTTKLFSTPKKTEIINLVNQNGLWKKLLHEKEKVKNLESKRFTLEKKEVKIMRLHRCIENIVLSHALNQKGSEVQIKKYNEILAIERIAFN